MSNLRNKNISNIFLLLAILSILLFYLLQYSHNKSHDGAIEAQHLSQKLDYQFISLQSTAKNVEQIIENNKNNYWNKLDNLFNREKYFCFVSVQDSVTYWNSNKIDAKAIEFLSTDGKPHIINLSSGWYLYTSSNQNNSNIAIFELIKSDYILNNNLLTSEYSSNYDICSSMNLTLIPEQATYKIYNKNGEFLLGTYYTNEDSSQNTTNYFSFLLYLLSYIFLILFIQTKLLSINFTKSNPNIGFILFIISIIFLRFLDVSLNFPNDLKISSIFAKTIFDIPTAISEGDLLLTTTLLIIISTSANTFYKKNKPITSPIKIILKYTVLWIYLLINIFILFHTTLDQEIYFYSEDITNNNTLIISIIIIIGLNISMYYAIFTYFILSKKENIPFYIPHIIILIGVFGFYLVSSMPQHILLITLVFTIAIIILKQTVRKYLSDVFLNHLIILVLLAAISSIIISNSYAEKTEKYQKHIGLTLSFSNDSVFENKYNSINQKIINDLEFRNLLFSDSTYTDEDIQQYMLSKYFNKTINKYDILITNCGINDLIEIQPEGEIHNCAEYFNTMIEENTTPIINSSLFKYESNLESNYYISKITLSDPDNATTKRNIFIEFISSHVPEGFGYPELLIDKQSYTLNLTEYSFAIYSEDHLTYKFGDYAYKTFFTFHKYFKFDTFFNYNGYRHYAIQISPKKYIIVSREITPTTLKIVVFSIIFLLLSIISIILYLIIYARKAIHLYRLNFKARLQTFIISTLTITFILMGVTTLIYIQDSNKKNIEKQLTEKTNSVLIELQHKLSLVNNLKNEDKEFLHQLLRKFSLVFFSDINLYDKSGELIATSRPEIFEKNLLSSYINPLAFNAIFNDNKLNFVTEENIGSLKYYSAFVPINLNSNTPIGIVNLPYFARQTQITKSYYIMLSYLINIYVIIGIIGALIGIIFSRYLTKPLVLLQESIATVQIDKHNEKIQWNKNDEIGLLINEYNLMVDKLEQSAELLKHSERESAWREVARQIAHEIKNPLTPMKLNVQYLEKAYKNNDPEFAKKMTAISKSLITQIDVLDDVAEMFSDFAKSKSLKLAKVNLKHIITSSVDLFNKNANISISVNYKDTETNLITLGFEKEILRVINNILKNATQSLDKNKKGNIILDINQDSKFINLTVTDNGKGIPEEMKSKIFHPYFTTKSSGTGLGLAIVKNIMNEIGGKVSFESIQTGGTRFLLQFPNAS